MLILNPQYFLHGEQPPIVGEIGEGFYLTQYQEQQQITDPATITHLKLNGCWVCLYFDGGTIFWEESEQPAELLNNGIDNALVLANLCEMSGVVGTRLNDLVK